MSQQPTAYLIDSSIYVFRAWFTMPDTLVNHKNEPMNAVYGFSDFLMKFIEQEQPTHMMCAFDQSLGSSSVRNEIYPEYKANRDPAPEELKQQFTYCRNLAKHIGVAEFASERYEADDIIATFSHTMREQGFRNVIVTGDKDLTQLVHENDLWWEFAKNKRMDVKGVLKNFGVHPHQIADMLALAGDKVDNITGVPGVGPKTAANLLAKFETLDNILDNIDKVGDMKFRGAKRIQTLLEQHQDDARLSKKLTVTFTDESLPYEASSLQRKAIDKDALENFFEESGFGNMRKQRWYKLLNI